MPREVTANLRAQVDAVNRANDLARKLQPQVAEALRPWLGRKVVKVDGYTPLAKVAEALPPMPQGREARAYVAFRNSSVILQVYVNIEVGRDTFWRSHEAYAYVGFLQGQELDKLCDPPALRSDWTAEEVVALENEEEVARAKLGDVRMRLGPFAR